MSCEVSAKSDFCSFFLSRFRLMAKGAGAARARCLVLAARAKAKDQAKAEPIKLSKMQASQEEEDKARKEVEGMDSKELRSKMASMVYFLNQHRDKVVQKSRGDVRKEYLIQFVAYKTKIKDAKKKTINNRKTKHWDKTTKNKGWWSVKQMNDHFGVEKAEAIRASGKLRSKSCSYTGRSEAPFMEYYVKTIIEQEGDIDETGYGVEVEDEAEARDLDVLRDCEHHDSENEQKLSTTDIKIKVEGGNGELDKLTEKIKNLKAAPRGVLRKVQDMNRNAKDIVGKAQKSKDKTANKYSEMLIKDTSNFVTKSNKAIKRLEKLATEDIQDESGLRRLVDVIESLDADYEQIEEWADRFGFSPSPASKKKRRITTKSAEESTD